MAPHHRFADERLNAFYQEFIELRQDFESDQEERRALRAALESNTRAIESVNTLIDQAFPDGDTVSHRLAHEAWIAAKAEEAGFWRELKLDLAKKGTWAVLVLLVGIALIGVKDTVVGWLR